MTHARILDILKTMTVLATVIVVGFLLGAISLSQTNIITVHILGVLMVAIITASRWYSINASLTSVLLFNYTFTEPIFALKAEDTGTQLALLITFLAAVFTSSYTVQVREKVRLSQQGAYRSGVIPDTGQMLQKTAVPADIPPCITRQLNKLLKRDITYFEQDGAGLKSPFYFRECSSPAAGWGPSSDTLKELTATQKCSREGEETGAAIEASFATAYRFLSSQSSGVVYGVMGILMGNILPGDSESSLAAVIIAQCSVALEKEYISRKRKEEAIMARAEQLRNNLPRSISRDLRTPLANISGNAGVLMSDGGSLTAEHRSRIYRGIHDDSMWLINLVENLLPITRMEGQGVHLHIEAELLEKVIDEAVRYINQHHEYHTIKANQIGGYILADMDTRPIVQAITNLTDSAVKCTPEGSTIMVNDHQEGSSAVTDVSDNGSGISDESRGKIFEMLHTTGHRSADGERDMGLGLPLCRAVLSVHRDTIEVLDSKPVGSILRPALPAKKVFSHE